MYMQDGVQSQVRHLLQNYFMDFIWVIYNKWVFPAHFKGVNINRYISSNSDAK